MLPHLVLIEQEVFGLFSIRKRVVKARPQSAAGGTVGSRGGTGMTAIFGPGGPIILPRTVQAVSTSRKYPNDAMLNVMYNYMYK